MNNFQQERRLVEQVQSGDANAFEELYQYYKHQAYCTAFFLTENTEDAQDVVQDTFVTVHLQIRKLKEPAAFRSWFYRILTNNAMRTIRKRKREVLQDDVTDTSIKTYDVKDISDALIQQEESRMLWKFIAEMNEKHRTVLVLYYYNNFSVMQIAQITGSLPGTVKSRLFHARKQLEQKLVEAERSSS